MYQSSDWVLMECGPGMNYFEATQGV